MPNPPDMPNPFDDAEVQAAMAAAGVVHKPGMARELMADLAPLLAAEGIDIDNLDALDPDTINAAFARVTKQYNLELFTPVGKHRTQSLAVLRQFSEALDDGYNDLALAILTAIQPEPTDTLPAVSHVIGAGLGLLDTWYTNPAWHDVLQHPRIAAWQSQPRAAARAIIAFAREGRAFDSLDNLMLRYAGLSVLDGTALAVAATVKEVAASRGVSMHQAFDILLYDDAHTPEASAPPVSPFTGDRNSKTSKTTAHLSGHSPKRDQKRTDYAATRNFGAWLKDQETIAAPSVEQETHMFAVLVSAARTAGINPHTPSGLERLVDELCLLRKDDPGFTASALATLDDYVHFRMLTSGDTTGWERAHDEVKLAMDANKPGANILDDVIELADQIDPEERRAAYAATRVVAMVPTLLEWIGKGRKTTGTGALRRADIAEAAAMVGVSALGVSSIPEYNPRAPHSDRTTVYALSMYDVPLLGSWWTALRTTGVIRTTSTMVRPGPAAATWSAEDLPPAELAEKVISIFIAEMLLEDLRRVGWYEEQVVALTVTRLMRALNPEASAPGEDTVDLMLKPRVTDKLRLLEQMGLLELSGDECVVPPVLRGAVARGLLVTAALLEQTTEIDQ